MRRKLVTTVCSVTALGLIGTSVAWADESASDAARLERIVLDNGAVVLLAPVEGTEWVGVESIYRVGFLDEPAAMTQVAHLVEHLVCRCATKSHAAGACFEMLNAKGVTNAETLADFTHYDYMLPSAELELALRVEAERLGSLRIDEATIRLEAPKCYQEADFVERAPQAGMFKHAFMAFNQAWRHRGKSALIRGGLEEIPLADVQAFHRRFYRPDHLVLVVAGGFDAEGAAGLIEKHLGSIESPTAEPAAKTDWSAVRDSIPVRWDSQVRAVCVAFAPPKDSLDRLALSLWGNLLMQRVKNTAAIAELSDAVFTSNQLWPVGVLPFFVYATVATDVEPAGLRAALEAEVGKLAEAGPTDNELRQMRFMAQALAEPPQWTRRVIEQQAAMLAGQMSVPAERAAGMVLGNVALQLGLRELLVGGDGQRFAAKLAEAKDEELRAIVRRCLPASKRFVTTLEPMQQAPKNAESAKDAAESPRASD